MLISLQKQNIFLLQTGNDLGIFSFDLLNIYGQDLIAGFNLSNNNVSAMSLAHGIPPIPRGFRMSP